MRNNLTRRTIIKGGALAAACLTLPLPITSFAKNNTMEDNRYEVIIIGGSYSGLSAAMALGRSLRRVLIIDSGLPCNRQTPQSHNFITHDGEKPAVIAQKAKDQVLKYDTVQFINGLAVKGEKAGDDYMITTDKGDSFTAKKLIFATGVKDIMPDIPGLSDCWGISVIHCPYCHGYEYRGKKTAVMANGERAVHIAALVSNLTDNIMLLTSGKADFNQEQRDRLSGHNITIIETEVSEIIHKQGHLQHIVFKDGSKMDFDVSYAALPFTQHSDIPESLGCELTEMGHLKTDMFQKTTVPGIFACGDSTSMMRSVAYSVATGNIAGAVCNNELTEESFT